MTQKAGGDEQWRDRRVPLDVFKATDEAFEIAQDAYFKYFAENALAGKRAFHSIGRVECEFVEMTLDLFQAPECGGGMTTGGTKSIFMAVRACCECAREAKGRQGPFNIVAADSAHPEFDKAGVRMDIPVKRNPLRDDFRADPAAMAAAIDYDTMMMVLALYFPHGVIGDISMLSPVAEETGDWLHLDVVSAAI